MEIKTLVICGQSLGGNWRNAEIMADADFPEIMYEADFPLPASCGRLRRSEDRCSDTERNINKRRKFRALLI